MKKIILFFVLMFLATVNAFAIILNDSHDIVNYVMKNKQNSKPIHWGLYRKNLESSIYQNWKPVKSDTSYKVHVRFVIGKNGELLESKVLKSSNNPEIDEAALKTLERTAPFEKLPKNFQNDSLPVEFTFYYNVLNEKTHNDEFSH